MTLPVVVIAVHFLGQFGSGSVEELYEAFRERFAQEYYNVIPTKPQERKGPIEIVEIDKDGNIVEIKEAGDE